MCMRNLHKNLRRDKHLRHYGRLQYGLFLKVNSAYWQHWIHRVSEWTLKKRWCSGALHFQQLATINLRRNTSTMCGTVMVLKAEGGITSLWGSKPANQSDISCQQILTGPQPGPGDSHGCPFRHFSTESLIATLEDDLQIRDPRILHEIKEAVSAKRFHIACTKVFEATHPSNGSLSESINHPNQYFESSFALVENKRAEIWRLMFCY